eukprot:15427438-Alexandrium_andersonii.AAC.1
MSAPMQHHDDMTRPWAGGDRKSCPGLCRLQGRPLTTSPIKGRYTIAVRAMAADGDERREGGACVQAY